MAMATCVTSKPLTTKEVNMIVYSSKAVKFTHYTKCVPTADVQLSKSQLT